MEDGEITTWKGYVIGRYNGHNRTDRGSVFFKTFKWKTLLNSKIGVFETEVDESGTSTEKHLE